NVKGGSRNMQETSLHFYHTKVKLNLQIIIFFPFMIGGYYMAYMGMVERSVLTVLMALFFAIVFSCFWVAAISQIVRSHTYITITHTYLQIEPQTNSEVTIYVDNIESIQVSESNLQKIIELAIYDESVFFDQLSTHTKIRLGPTAWFGFTTFTMGYNAIRRRARPQLWGALDNTMASTKGESTEQFSITDMGNKPVDSKKDFMKKYGPDPSAPLVIAGNYFKKAY